MVPRAPLTRTGRRAVPPAPVHDLQSQLEDLWRSVWQAEANWRFDDRLDVALKIKRERRG